MICDIDFAQQAMIKLVCGGIFDNIQNCLLYDAWLLFQSLYAIFLKQLFCAITFTTSCLDFIPLVSSATINIVILRYTQPPAFTPSIFLVPHVELWIEGGITFDMTCSDVSRYIDELVEAIRCSAVFLEAIPQTL